MSQWYQRAMAIVMGGVASGIAAPFCLSASVVYAADTAAAVAASSTGVSTAVSTAATTAAPTSPAGMLQVMLGLILVLGVLVVIAWSVKKIGVGKQANGGAIKIVGGIHVGNRERIMVIEVANEWIVVGVTSASITALSTMPKQEGATLSPSLPLAKNFSSWLQQTIEKRKATAAIATATATATSTPPDSARDA